MPTAQPTLAVVGATGAVGQTIIAMLGTREDVWGEIRLLASGRSQGHAATGDGYVRQLEDGAFDDVDVAIFAVPGTVAEQWVPIASAAGAIVVDGSGSSASHGTAALVVPEINADAARDVKPGSVIASPSAPAVMAANPLASLSHRWHLTEAIVTTYQSVSDAGVQGVWQLYDEVTELSGDRSVGQTPGDVRRMLADLDVDSPFPAPIAFNVVPWVGGPQPGSRWSPAESLMRSELRRLLGLPYLRVATTCVQVPVIATHCMSVHATFEQPLQRSDAVQALTEDSNSVVVLDDPDSGEWPTPVDTVGTDPTFVGRIRQSEDFPRSVEMFICADNLRRGSGLNLLQIAELAIGRG